MKKVIIDECRQCIFMWCYESGTCYQCGCNHPDAPESLKKDNLYKWCEREKEGFPKECPLNALNGEVLIKSRKMEDSEIQDLKCSIKELLS